MAAGNIDEQSIPCRILGKMSQQKSMIIFEYCVPTAGSRSYRRRGWGKHITFVDTTKRDGYAFEGEFLREGENELLAGSVVVQKRPTGSNRNASWEWELGSVQESGEIAWREEILDVNSFLSFREAVAEALGQEQCPKARTEQLRKRIESLRAELEATEAELTERLRKRIAALRVELDASEAELAALRADLGASEAELPPL